MARGWTWIDDSSAEELTDAQMDARSNMLDSLARQWSELIDSAERRSFMRSADADDREMEPEEWEMVERHERLRQRQHDVQVKVLEEEMFALGARMMRAYEHWNEDERYMQYMEEGRFSGYED